jgi:DNA-binding MarR family transcriptional regulator
MEHIDDRDHEEEPDTSDVPESDVQLGPLSGFLGYHLRLAQEASFQAFARRVNTTGLRSGYFSVLVLIGLNPGITQTALSRATARDKSTLTPTLRLLENRKLIRREQFKTDRRSYMLRLTPEGEEAAEELMQHARRHEREMIRIVGEEKSAEFIAILHRIAEGFQNGNGNAA